MVKYTAKNTNKQKKILSTGTIFQNKNNLSLFIRSRSQNLIIYVFSSNATSIQFDDFSLTDSRNIPLSLLMDSITNQAILLFRHILVNCLECKVFHCYATRTYVTIQIQCYIQMFLSM